MPRKKPEHAQQAHPDDMKEPQRHAAGRRSSGEYEDVEASRMRPRDDAAEELADEDILESVDLDAAPEGEGPDA